jgi:hypothetical protein
MTILRKYKIGHDYIDDIANSKDKDQFVKWLPGIGNSKGIRCAKFHLIKDEGPAFIILVTREINHKHYNPWDDIIDFGSSKIYYWGDAKHSIVKNYMDFDGNKALMVVYENYLDGNNFKVPPILHFSKKKTGTISFNGVCIITNVETTWFQDMQKPVKNLRFELSILDAEEVNVKWLLNRANSSSKEHIDNRLAPKAWDSFLHGKINKLTLIKKEILNRENQLPGNNSYEAEILLN